jgi:glycosyltransferase involved in cell wall biosynthesis
LAPHSRDKVVGTVKFFFLNSHAHRALDPAETKVSGGAELQVALLARELVQRGHEVTIAGGDSGQEKHRVIDRVTLRTAGRFHTGAWADTVGAVPKVAKLLAETKPDFVCVLGWTAWLDLLCTARKAFEYKAVYICGLDPEIDGTFGRTHGWKGKLFERGVRRSDYRFAMSDYQSELFRKAGLPHGLYRNLIRPRVSPRGKGKSVDLLWVARCQKIKRPHLFLDLAERLPDANCEMICPREDAGLWEEVARRARSIPNVVFRESVPYAEIQERYDAARFLVSTSEAEGFPNNMIQAAQGSAGILSLEVDPDGFIGKFGAGFCANGDFGRLVDASSKRLSGESDWQSEGRGAERMVAEWLDNDANTEAFLEYLRP